MKRSLFRDLKSIGVAAVGVFLARGASADTIVTFDTRPAGQGNNARIIDGFGSNATNSSAGVQVIGTGTPDITLTWQSDSGRWDYYTDAVWTAGQLDGSNVGVSHEVVFTPTPTVPVIIKSLNFHPYYNNGRDYSYDWSVRDAGGTALTNGNITFRCDATKNHPVNMNYTGGPGQALTLHIERTGGSDGSQNIAVDDIAFAQAAELLPPVVIASAPSGGQTSVAPEIAFRAVVKDGDFQVATNSIQLAFNGNDVSPSISVVKTNNQTAVSYQAPGLLPSGSTNRFTLRFEDNAPSPKGYTNQVQFVVAGYSNMQLPAPFVFEDFNSATEGGLPAGWSQTNYTDVSLSDANLDLGNLDSTAYAKWVVVEASRFTNSFVGYSDTNAAPVDYSRVLSANPSNVVNGAYVKILATGRFIMGNSGYRNGRSQVMYLYSPDFNLAGKLNVYLSYHSLWEQNQDSIGAVEYSIDLGQTWLPIVYMLDGPDVLLDANQQVDPVATLTTEGASAFEAVAFYTDPADGLDKGGTYGAFIGAVQSQWSTLAPYISPRVDDDPSESKRVELFRLPQADNRANVRFRFAHAGSDSWYFGIDDFGLYSIALAAPPSLSASLSGNQLTISWPVDATGFNLEEADSLTNPAWSPVGGVANNSVTVLAGPGNKFFRLRK
jgi:hypothetical protein